jgi:hypothetical protein
VTASEDSTEIEKMHEIERVIESFGAEALGGETPDAAARRWIAAGFDDAEDVSDWLRARCFSATSAQALDDAGITPEQAALRTTAGVRDYEETLAYKFVHDDLSIDEARRIITNAFWNL